MANAVILAAVHTHTHTHEYNLINMTKGRKAFIVVGIKDRLY